MFRRSGPYISDTDPSSYFGEDPKINIEKSGEWIDKDADGHADADEVIEYTFVVTNAGNIPLSSVTVEDEKLDAPGALYVSGDTNGDGKLDLD